MGYFGDGKTYIYWSCFVLLMQVLSVLLGLVYFRQTYDQKGVMNINGFLFLMQLQITVGNPMTVANVSIASLFLRLCN